MFHIEQHYYEHSNLFNTAVISNISSRIPSFTSNESSIDEDMAQIGFALGRDGCAGWLRGMAARDGCAGWLRGWLRGTAASRSSASTEISYRVGNSMGSRKLAFDVN